MKCQTLKTKSRKTKSHMPRTMKTVAALPALFAASLMLGACAGKPTYIACPDISAPQEGTNAFTKMDETGEIIDVRLNGVRGLCEAGADGTTAMTVSVGLKLKRAASDELVAGVAQVQMAAFIIDPADNVVANETILYKTGFAKDQRIHYPAASYETVIADGNRLVISLVPAL